MNKILCRCTPCIRCQAAQCSVGFRNRLKFSNFLIGNNAIIHVPLYQVPSCCLALLTIWRSWCTSSQRSVQKERCYATLKNKSSKEELSGTKIQSWHNICWVLSHFKYMQCCLAGCYLQLRHQHWLSTHRVVIGQLATRMEKSSDWWAKLGGKGANSYFWRLYGGFSYSLCYCVSNLQRQLKTAV